MTIFDSKNFVITPMLGEESGRCVCCKNFDGRHMFAVKDDGALDFIRESMYSLVHELGERKIRIVVVDETDNDKEFSGGETTSIPPLVQFLFDYLGY